MVPIPTFEKLRFRFLLQKVTVTVPVPVPAPYLDHEKQIFQKKMLAKILPFFIVSCFTRKKLVTVFRIQDDWIPDPDFLPIPDPGSKNLNKREE
jgi:hypothetical protein